MATRVSRVGRPMGKRSRLIRVDLETRKYMSSMFLNGFQRSWSQTFDKVGYRCAMMGGNAVRIGNQLGSGFLQESFDGNVLYSTGRQVNTELTMFSPDGAFPESAVEGLPPIIHQGLWTVVPGGIYFVPADAPQSLRYFDFATKKIRRILEAPKNFGTGLSVSPGGRWILYSQADEDNTDIMLVDHFQ